MRDIITSNHDNGAQIPFSLSFSSPCIPSLYIATCRFLYIAKNRSVNRNLFVGFELYWRKLYIFWPFFTKTAVSWWRLPSNSIYISNELSSKKVFYNYIILTDYNCHGVVRISIRCLRGRFNIEEARNCVFHNIDGYLGAIIYIGEAIGMFWLTWTVSTLSCWVIEQRTIIVKQEK